MLARSQPFLPESGFPSLPATPLKVILTVYSARLTHFAILTGTEKRVRPNMTDETSREMINPGKQKTSKPSIKRGEQENQCIWVKTQQ